MPKKTSEELREKVVALRKAGATYTQIEANPETHNPETGQKLARPTLIKILKEAGLTRSASAVQQTTKPEQSVSTPSGRPSSPVHSSNGVDEFMPKNVKVTPKKKVEYQCEYCGTEFLADDGDDLPDECPECGN